MVQILIYLENISVNAGFYKIEELKNPRYEAVGNCKTVQYAETATTDTATVKYLNDAGEKDYCTNISDSNYQTSGVIAYCNLLEEVTSPALATYRVEYHNKIKRYDQLSHSDNHPNAFSAADRYVTALSAVCPEIIPVYSDTSTFVLDKSKLEIYLLYNKSNESDPENNGTRITGNNLKNVKITEVPTSWTVTESDDNFSFTIPSTAETAGQSFDVTVSYTYTDEDENSHTQTAVMTLNYSSIKSDLVKYVTLRSDIDNHLGFKTDNSGDIKQSVTLIFRQNARAESYNPTKYPIIILDAEGQELNFTSEQMASPAGYTIDLSGYNFVNWQYETPDGDVIDLVDNTKTPPEPDVNTLQKIQNYIFNGDNYSLTSFKFSAKISKVESQRQCFCLEAK